MGFPEFLSADFVGPQMNVCGGEGLGRYGQWEILTEPPAHQALGCIGGWKDRVGFKIFSNLTWIPLQTLVISILTLWGALLTQLVLLVNSYSSGWLLLTQLVT